MKRNLGIIAACLVMLAGPAQAARVWIEGVEIQDILAYYEGGYNIVTVVLDPATTLNTGCTPTDTHKIVSWWSSGTITTPLQTWLSLMLSAQAQGLPVDLMIEDSSCNTGAQWDDFGTPYGLGMNLNGARINGS